MDNTNTTNPTIHIFQAAGLGQAPFRLTTVTAEGGACQFCGTGIIFRFYLRGVDGRTFHVGSDCVMKTGDAGLIRVVEHEVKKRQAELRNEREKAQLAALREHLTQPAVVEGLKSQAHPFTWHARQGKTMLDYAEFIMRCGGTSAKKKLAKSLLPAMPRGRKKAAAAAA
jgi:hypothetical protein